MRVPNEKKYQFDAAGWGFWGLLFALFLAPSIYGVWIFTFRVQRSEIAIGAGVVVAALAAGVVSWAVNAFVQRGRKKQRQAERKLAKKKR